MIRTIAAVLGALVFSAAAVQAQAASPSALKRGAPPEGERQVCGPSSPPSAVTPEAKRRARDLAQNGRQAAILGDRRAALAQLREASTIDPTDAELAYELARAYESEGQGANAANEYCRFLALSPDAPEAAEARSRATTLMPATKNSGPSIAATLFDAGVQSFESGKPMEAEAKFAAAIKQEPAWAEAYYDRALARAAIGDKPQAATDLEEYLRLKPDASDRAQVVAQIDALRRRPVVPQQVLGLGLVLPGAGQFYVQRPVRGALSLAGAGVAIAFALQTRQRTVISTVTDTATDPFGNEYTFTRDVPHRVTEHPNAVPGALIYAAVAVGSAIDAYMFARRGSAPTRRVSVTALPTRNGFTARVRLLLR